MELTPADEGKNQESTPKQQSEELAPADEGNDHESAFKQQSEEEGSFLLTTLCITNTSASRATFLAGYCYYEIGRYSGTANLPAYPFVLASAFCFAVMTAATSAYVSYYIQRTELSRREEVARGVQSVVRAGEMTFDAALQLFTLSIAMLGFRYYQSSPARYIPAVAGLLTLLAIQIAKGSWQLSRKFIDYELSLAQRRPSHGSSIPATTACNELDQEPQRMFDASNENAFRSILVLAFAQSGIARYQPMLWNSSLLNRLYLLVVTVATVFSIFAMYTSTSVALFIAKCPTNRRSVSQLCVRHMRPFVAITNICTTVSLSCMLLALSLMGWGVTYNCGNAQLENDLDCYFKLRYLPAVSAGCGFVIFVGGFVYIRAHELFAREREQRLRSDETISTQLSQIHTKLDEFQKQLKDAAKKEAKESQVAEKDEKQEEKQEETQEETGEEAQLEGSVVEDEKDEAQEVATMRLELSIYGTQATIAASTVFYNIVTYQTDVLTPFQGWGLPASGEPPGVTNFTIAFLISNLITFTAGLSALYLSTLAQGALQRAQETATHHSSRQCSHLARRFRSSGTITAVFALAQLSLLGLFGVLGTLGFAKYEYAATTPSARHLPHILAVFAGCGVLMVSWGNVQVYTAREFATSAMFRELLDHETLSDQAPLRGAVQNHPLRWATANSDTQKQSEHQRILTQIGNYAPRSFFFGSFAYNALVFFYRINRPIVSNAYGALMAFSMVAALTVSAWEKSYTIALNSQSLRSESAKEHFASQLLTFSRTAYLLFILSMASFCVAFIFFGFIKNSGSVGVDEASTNAFHSLALTMLIAGSCCVLVIFHAWRVVISAYLDVASGLSFYKRKLRGNITASGSRVEVTTTQSSEASSFTTMGALVNSIADQTTFVAGLKFPCDSRANA